MTFLDDSAAAHPPGTVRLANMSPFKAVSAIGNSPILIEPDKTKLLGSPKFDEQNRFEFDFALAIPGQPTQPDPTKLLRFRSPEAVYLFW